MVITQNGEAKAVLQDVRQYEQTQETMAFLKILALGNRQIDEGRVRTADRRLLGGQPGKRLQIGGLAGDLADHAGRLRPHRERQRTRRDRVDLRVERCFLLGGHLVHVR